MIEQQYVIQAERWRRKVRRWTQPNIYPPGLYHGPTIPSYVLPAVGLLCSLDHYDDEDDHDDDGDDDDKADAEVVAHQVKSN